MWLEWAEHRGGRHHVIPVTGLRAVTWRVRKESCCPFLWWICFSPRDTFLSHPTRGFISYRSWPHTHTHTHRGGYKFHWRRKGKDGYFSWQEALISDDKLKIPLTGIARRKPSLAPRVRSATAEERKREEQGPATVYKWSVSKWQKAAGDVASEREDDVGKVDFCDGQEGSITDSRELLCCGLIYLPTRKGAVLLLTWWEINKLCYHKVIALFLKGKKDYVSNLMQGRVLEKIHEELCSALENWVV